MEHPLHARACAGCRDTCPDKSPRVPALKSERPAGEKYRRHDCTGWSAGRAGAKGTLLREATLQTEEDVAGRMIKDGKCVSGRGNSTGKGPEVRMSRVHLGNCEEYWAESRGKGGEGAGSCVTQGLGGSTDVPVLLKARSGTAVFGAGREHLRIYLLQA